MGQTVATNKKALRDFVLSDRVECGIELKGAEVKSIRAGNVNFTDSFALIDKDEIFLYNLHIDPYAQASYLNTDPVRIRKLLLHKKEIQKLSGKVIQHGLILVPINIYFNKKGIVKVEIALGKGRKLYDKREVLKKKNISRDIDRNLKQNKR